MSPWLQHLPVLPIVVPLATAALLLFVSESRRGVRVALSVGAVLAQVAIAVALLYLTTDLVQSIWTQGIGVYPISAWPAPFGIVLVVDRLAALMLVLAALLALCSLVYSLARWDRVGVHYYPLMQLLLMGLNGAFLTGDLFNLFVFFEVMLAASYGLMLHGSGTPRVKAGLHYVVVNLTSSLLFLIGVALIYSVTGTLNMADLAVQVRTLSSDDRALFDAGAAVLGVAFLIKAGSWPLNFWLPNAYAAAGAPVAAVFSIMTKVGIYALLRIGSLLSEADAPSPFAGDWLLLGGLATIVFGIVGMLAAQQLARLVAYCVVVSSGTMLAAFGIGAATLIAPALFYQLTSVLGTGAFFMLTGMTERTRRRNTPEADTAPLPDVSYQAFGVGDPEDPRAEEGEVGIAIPAVMAFLGLAFVCCVLLVTGLPPLSGFMAKFALLAALVRNTQADQSVIASWTLIVLVLATGLAGLIALTRIGMRLFWTVTERMTPRLRVIEAAPVALLIALALALAAGAGPVMTFMDSAAYRLSTPDLYIGAVLSAQESLEETP